MRRRKRDIEKLEQDVEELRRLTSQEITGEEVERLRREVAELKREFWPNHGEIGLEPLREGHHRIHAL